MWQEVKPTAADRLVEALEIYRKSDRVTRECVQAELLGMETPAAYDRVERAAIKNGSHSYEHRRLDEIGRNVEAIVRSLKAAGVAT